METAGTRWLEPAQQRAWRAYLSATRLLSEHLERESQQAAGIPHAYYEILVRLSEAPDRLLRMSDLAAACQSSRSRLSHAVRRLEEDGWIRRDSCPTDRRGALAVLTDRGFAALAAAAPAHVAAVRSCVFDVLSAAEVEQLRSICETISARVEQQGAPTGPLAGRPS